MALTSLTVDKCNRVAGGVKRLLLCDAADISAITFDVSASNHAVTDIDFDGGATVFFEEFTFKRGECRYESNTERQDNGVDVTTVNIFMNVPAPTSAQLYALEQLRDTCELVAVIQEFGSNTLLRVMGADQAETGTLEFQSLNGGSGSVRTDANTFELNLMGEQEQPPFVLTEANSETVQSDIIDYLLTGA
jgi:hypothetical protein